jgi:hypothetical protein
MWLTESQDNISDNAIAFTHAYQGMLVFSTGSWFEFVGPQYMCLGKKFADIKGFSTFDT